MLGRTRTIAWIVVCLMVFGGAAMALEPAPRTGTWRAWLESPGGELPFELEIESNNGAWSATIINGEERSRVSGAAWDGNTLTLDMDYYNSRLTAGIARDGTRLDGVWEKIGRTGTVTQMKFHAAHGKARRFAGEDPGATKPSAPSVDGRWSARFSKDEGAVVALFRQSPGQDAVTGTFLTTGGDYRYLAGNLDGDRLRLSSFDGARAFLFDARLQADGTLKGDFWSGAASHDTWTAQRDSNATLPDPFALTKGTGSVPLADLVFPDLSGKPHSISELIAGRRAVVIEIFGSWCPNCHDEAEYLVELDRRYRDRGLVIVGLAFEMTGDFKRNAAQVRKYVERHGLKYPILISGATDREQVSAALPFLEKLQAYPTTLFLDGTGRIRAIHTGFTGPATGEEHDKLRKDFEERIEAMLVGKPGDRP